MKPLKKIFVAILTLLCFGGALWLIGFILFSAYVLTAKPEGKNVETQAIIVLTGGTNRIDEGLHTLIASPSQSLLISGVNKDVKIRDLLNASSLNTYDQNTILNHCCVSIDYESKDTYSNATEAHKWVTKNNFSTIRLITSNYHMPRSYFVFKQAMPNTHIIRHTVKPSNLDEYSKDHALLLIVEYHKLLAAAFFSLQNIKPT